jgi:UTP--glucose-1-phosphate uridylyltransferase
MTKVTKAVIAAAGFGTRFLPQTKAMPKEMLPLVDKPIIQYVVEELVEAGIRDIIIVTNQQKRAIEDHFDAPGAELASVLAGGGKQPMLDEINNIADMANFVFVRQKQAIGNAAPLLHAGHLMSEPFIYIWGDEYVLATPSHVRQMISIHEKTGGSVVPCIPLTKDEDFDRYGIISGAKIDGNLIKMDKIVEKPGRAAAPSNLANVGGYLLTPDVVKYVEASMEAYDGTGELRIQTAFQAMMQDGHEFFGFEIENAHYYDAGNKVEYLKTVVDFALMRDDISEEFAAYLKQVTARL